MIWQNRVVTGLWRSWDGGDHSAKPAGESDLLVITADHGCDPTWQGYDHTREHIPVLAYGGAVKPGSIGCRQTFADIGQSISSHLSLAKLDYGASFLSH